MKDKKFWTAWSAISIAMVIYDWIVHGEILNRIYYTQLPDLFRGQQGGYNPIWFVLDDLIMAFVFLWFYRQVQGSFAKGVKGGATFGLLAGVFAAFPSQIAWHTIFKGFPYPLGWAWTVAGIAFYLMAGSIAGALYKKG